MTPLTQHAPLHRRAPEYAGWVPVEPGVYRRPDGSLYSFPPGAPECVLEPEVGVAAPQTPRRPMAPRLLELVRFPARA